MAKNERGFFSFVLHGHIPYCRKAGVWPFGEEWVLEAMAETYIPLLNLLYELRDSEKDYKLTMGFTPVLLEQLSDEYMIERFQEYAQSRIRLAREDVKRFESCNDGMLKDLASFYEEYYVSILETFQEKFNKDLVGAFRRLQDDGVLEIIASVATHGYLPLMDTPSIYAQMKVGVDTYERHFRRRPRGIWLPECGYRPDGGDLEDLMEKLGIEYFFVDTHSIQGGKGVGLYGDGNKSISPPVEDFGERLNKTTYRPYYLVPGKISVFGRNERTGLQVWSAEWGYPGDGSYREFHKRDSVSGFHYWRVTSKLTDLDGKELYDRGRALDKAKEQSDHFVHLVDELLTEFNEESGKPGILVAPYDVELFGHWWFEGIDWLGQVLEKMARNPRIRMTTGSEYLRLYAPDEVISLPESSWGLGGKHYIWENGDTKWMWSDLQIESKRMKDIVERFKDTEVDSLAERALNQASRELMLLQSSDWPFLVTTKQAAEYASGRFMEHKRRFNRLIEAVENQEFHGAFIEELAEIEERDNLFPDVDYRVYEG